MLLNDETEQRQQREGLTRKGSARGAGPSSGPLESQGSETNNDHRQRARNKEWAEGEVAVPGGGEKSGVIVLVRRGEPVAHGMGKERAHSHERKRYKPCGPSLSHQPKSCQRREGK